MKFPGILYIISAPSGVGKSTLIQTLIKKKSLLDKVKLSVSYTTRKIRSNEINGVDYFFISKKKFKCMINQKLFFEYAKTFNNYYGTLKKNIKNVLFSGKNIILNIDSKGAEKICEKKILKKKIIMMCKIFILPPSKEELEKRLRIRGEDSEEAITIRMQQLKSEISYIKKYDYIIINDNFEKALIDLESIFISNELKLIFQQKKYQLLINKLIIDI